MFLYTFVIHIKYTSIHIYIHTYKCSTCFIYLYVNKFFYDILISFLWLQVVLKQYILYKEFLLEFFMIKILSYFCLFVLQSDESVNEISFLEHWSNLATINCSNRKVFNFIEQSNGRENRKIFNKFVTSLYSSSFLKSGI